MNAYVPSQYPGSLRYSVGFTVVELMIVLAVMGIMAAIGAPAFQRTLAGAELRQTTSELVSAINIARSQAINLRIPVRVAPNGSWASGWSVVYDYPAAVPADARGEKDQAISLSGRVSIASSVGDNELTFMPSGFVVGGEKTFELCRSGGQRRLVVSPMGRVSNETGTC